MPKPKREPVKPSNIVHCVECNLNFDLLDKNVPTFEQHLKKTHGIACMRGKRSLLMHIDGDTWFSHQWEWEIGGKKFIQNTVSPRFPARLTWMPLDE